MSQVTCDITTSADGFAAGLSQSAEDRFGEGGGRLTEWMLNPHGRDQQVMDAWQRGPAPTPWA